MFAFAMFPTQKEKLKGKKKCEEKEKEKEKERRRKVPMQEINKQQSLFFENRFLILPNYIFLISSNNNTLYYNATFQHEHYFIWLT